MTNAYETPRSDIVNQQAPANPPLLGARGRIGRLRFLAHSAWMSAVVYVPGFALAMALGTVSDVLAMIAFLITGLALIWVSAVLHIKRSHDFNVNGWMALLGLIPLANLVFVFMPGTKGTNRYGPMPTRNTVWFWLGGLIMPIVFVLGVLAAIAIPAYQDYASRAMVSIALTESMPVKTAIAEYAINNGGELPDAAALDDLNLGQPVVTQYASLRVVPGSGEIVVTLCPQVQCAPSLAGKTLVFEPAISEQGFPFDCYSDEIAQRYLPQSCIGLR